MAWMALTARFMRLIELALESCIGGISRIARWMRMPIAVLIGQQIQGEYRCGMQVNLAELFRVHPGEGPQIAEIALILRAPSAKVLNQDVQILDHELVVDSALNSSMAFLSAGPREGRPSQLANEPLQAGRVVLQKAGVTVNKIPADSCLHAHAGHQLGPGRPSSRTGIRCSCAF